MVLLREVVGYGRQTIKLPNGYGRTSRQSAVPPQAGFEARRQLNRAPGNRVDLRRCMLFPSVLPSYPFALRRYRPVSKSIIRSRIPSGQLP